MANRIHVYVSASQDLEPEREAIGKTIAQMPITVGWVIKRTPPPGVPLSLDEVIECNFYLFLMGQDITAPAGHEWRTAMRAGRKILAYLKEGPHTPAAQAFIHDADIPWTPFRNGAELATLVQRALAAGILDRAEAFELTMVDLESLAALAKGVGATVRAGGTDETITDPTTRKPPSGAGGGGVIIAPGRDIPEGGVLINRRKKGKLAD